MIKKYFIVLVPLLVLFPFEIFASTDSHFNGGELGLIWIVPFAGILLSIAILPLLLPHFWHHHFGKISFFWAALFLIPFGVTYGVSEALAQFLHSMLLEYIPFIILLFTLFTVAGGVRVSGSLSGTPKINFIILLLGTVLASWMGTTGAAMLLIRPLIRANKDRKYKVHTVVFFIFLVANIGGSLTPLGDPPLFLGFLQGVSFFWPTTHLFMPMAFASTILLVLYFLIDIVLFKKEGGSSVFKVEENPVPLKIHGGINILLIGGIVGAVLLSGIWHSGVEFNIYGTIVTLQSIARDVLLLVIAGLSLTLTVEKSRIKNGFSWFPIIEVGKLFLGIFVTIIPAIAILRAGMDGSLSSIINLVTDANGGAVNSMYFWLTGILSSFLDNAPTYLIFFNTAGGNAESLMGDGALTLLAISAGAVFMGANTYIGNAPNFMVKAIAESEHIKMPSFFGYMLWSFGILMPVFILVSLIWFM